MTAGSSHALARYFDGSLSLEELENEVASAASDAAKSEQFRTAIEAEFASGRLPTQLYHALLGILAKADAPVDATLVESEEGDRSQADATEIEAAPADESITSEFERQVDIPLDPTQFASTTEAIATRATSGPETSAVVEKTEVIEPPSTPPDPTATELVADRSDSAASVPTGSNWARPDLWSDKDTGPVGPGSVIKNRFLIEEQLGKGGMGTVFKARDRRREEARDADPYVAIKVLNEDFKNHPQALVSLQRESTKAQTLAHPNIITVYDFDREGSTIFMIMELMRGQSLSQFIRSRRTGVSREEAAPIIMAMAEGLAYAHKRGIVHSDFKPGNVFITEDGRIKLLDFGIARASHYAGAALADKDEFDAGELGALTPGYASLEMIDGVPPDPADDVYALAVTAYQLLAGDHPYDRLTAREALEANRSPKPLRDLSRREWRTIAHGLELRREDRIADAAEFLKRFRGPTRFRKIATVAMVLLSLSAAFFAYDSMQARGPDVAFDALPAEVQAQFSRRIELGDSNLEILPNEAVDFYIDAYELHPRNPVAEARLDKAISLYVRSFNWTANSPLDKRQAVRFVDRWLANEHLASNSELKAFRARLVDEGNAR